MEKNSSAAAVAMATAVAATALLINAPEVAAAQAPAAPASPQAPNAPASPASPTPGVAPANGVPAGAPGQVPTAVPGATPLSGGSVPAATQPDSPRFDLARTIRSAVENSAALVQARRNVQIDEKRADEAAALARPQLSGNASATRFDQATKIQLGGSPPIEVLKEHTEALSVVASERIDLLGQIRATVGQARLQTLADRFTLDQISDQRTLQAQTTYFNLLRTTHQVQVAEASLRQAQAQQTIANRLYLGQIGQKIDLLRANTQVAQAQQDITAAENARDIARAQFNDLVGRPLDAPVVLDDVPGVTVGADITAGSAAAPVGTPPVSPAFAAYPAPTAEVAAIDVNQSIAAAQTQRPEVLQSAVFLRVAETGVRIARFGQEPTFALSASGNYFPTTSFQDPRQRTAALTVSVSIPFYDGGVTRDRIAEARLRTENAQTSLESAKSDVALGVRQAYLNLATAARQIDAANAALQQAVAARQLAQVRYEGQVGLYLEVTDTQAALVRAENSQIDSVYNYLIARAQYLNALGTPQATSLATAGTHARTN